ncbi:MAG: hypothetical protein IPN34_13310 [Planctomycetes bacterium]|nr:hypothetical protein [Planctomycetota bacterium]
MDLRQPTAAKLAIALLDAGPETAALLRAFAAAAKPAGTVAYAAAEHLPPGRRDARAGLYLADLVWAEEPEERSPWHLYRGLRLALIAGGQPWLGLAKLADLRVEHRLLALSEDVPPLRDIDAFWRGHRYRQSGELLLLAAWDGGRGQVYGIDGEGSPRLLAEHRSIKSGSDPFLIDAVDQEGV